MPSYEAQAEQAIEVQDWRAAEQFLITALAKATNRVTSYRVRLKKAALPLYRAAAEASDGAIAIYDAELSEVYQESLDILSDAQEDYKAQFSKKAGKSESMRSMQGIGFLAELSIFGFITRARIRQLDDVLALPSHINDDQAEHGAYDFNVYYPTPRPWQTTRRTKLQTKHTLKPHDALKYPADIVLVGYRKLRSGYPGLDSRSVTSDFSLTSSLLLESTQDSLEDEAWLDGAYETIEHTITNWPEERKRLLKMLEEESELVYRSQS